MHDGMPCDPIQGQGQGHGASEVRKIARNFNTTVEYWSIKHVVKLI